MKVHPPRLKKKKKKKKKIGNICYNECISNNTDIYCFHDYSFNILYILYS